MKAIQMTYELAMALSGDAGNRLKRKTNRTNWNEADWNVSVEAFNKAMAIPT